MNLVIDLKLKRKFKQASLSNTARYKPSEAVTGVDVQGLRHRNEKEYVDGRHVSLRFGLI